MRSRLLLAINLEGHKELLGMWIAPSAKEPSSGCRCSTPLQNRGLKDIFIACVDGLSGLPEAIETIYPQTRVQLCMVQRVAHLGSATCPIST
jgi:putative transposase